MKSRMGGSPRALGMFSRMDYKIGGKETASCTEKSLEIRASRAFWEEMQTRWRNPKLRMMMKRKK